MKKVKKFLIIVALFCIIFLIVLNYSMPKYDNLARKEDVITQQYSKKSIEKLANTIEQSQLDFSDLEAQFSIECIRKTHQGYYAVLLQSDGSNVFIFMDDHLSVTKLLSFTYFMTKDEFVHLCFNNKNTTISEILLKDRNTLPTPTSMTVQTAHIVQEGVIIVTYRTFENGEVLNEAVVDSIEFFDNATIAAAESHYALKHVPYILEIDKAN